MFVNISNHPSSKWGEKQTEAARKWGEIVDIQFPNIPPFASEEEVFDIAMEVAKKLKNIDNGSCVHVMGELGATWYIVDYVLSSLCYTDCVYSTTERKVIERDGQKISTFEFVRFRHYGGTFRE